MAEGGVESGVIEEGVYRHRDANTVQVNARRCQGIFGADTSPGYGVCIEPKSSAVQADPHG